MDKQHANSWQTPTSSPQRKACSPSPPWRKALIKGTLVWMLLFAVLTCSIRSQPTAPRFLAAAPSSLQPSSSKQHTKIFSTQYRRRKYDTPLLTVALTTRTHPNQRRVYECCLLSCSQPTLGTLSPAGLWRAGSTSAAGAAPSSSSPSSGRMELRLHKQMSTEWKRAWKAPGTNLLFCSAALLIHV